MSTDISRRDLLGASAVALTGLATASAFATSQAAHADEAPANSDLASTFEGTVSWQAEYDVVVVGFGGAGANTAIAAADEGASVLLIDKAPEAEAGGNSAVCVQLLCSTDDPESMTTYIKAMRGNFETPSDAIIETYAQGMAENADWITYLGGEPTVATKAATNDTAEWPELPGSQSFTILTVHQGRGDGAAYALFKSNVEQRENITVWYEAPATGLIQDPATGIVHGVEVSVDGQVVNVRAKNGVVLTLGGFENNSRYQQSFLRRAFWPSLGHAVYNTGDGIGLAISAGAELWHMASFESNNFEFCDEDLGCTWLWGNNIRGILIGENGKRFINEHELGGAKHGHLPYGGTWQAPRTARAVLAGHGQHDLQPGKRLLVLVARRLLRDREGLDPRCRHARGAGPADGPERGGVCRSGHDHRGVQRLLRAGPRLGVRASRRPDAAG